MQMTKDAPGVIYEMDHWGCPFSRFDDGRIAQRPFGGAGYPRTCYGADKTGHYLLHTLVEQAYELEVKMYIEVVRDLRSSSTTGRCRGVVAYDMMRGGFEAFRGDAVVMATGGAGRIYCNTTNAIISTGGGAAMAYHAGVPRKDMEFIQFHPTGLFTTHILMSEGVPRRGRLPASTTRASASWSATRPRPWSWRRATSPPAPSSTEIDEGAASTARTTSTSTCATWAPRSIVERLPGIRDLAIHFEGVDPIDEPIPIQPCQHYTMGGIDTDVDGRTKLPGFYAAGECACVSVHGANRLGGNSLLETIVFGRRAGHCRRGTDLQAGGGTGGGDVTRRRGPGRNGAGRRRRRAGRPRRARRTPTPSAPR